MRRAPRLDMDQLVAPGGSRTLHVSFAEWMVACTLGALIGFGVGGGLAAIAFGAIPNPATSGLASALVLACVGAGLIEGAVLGTFQWLALRKVFPSLTIGAWTSVTALAGATGWALGALPSIAMSLMIPSDVPAPVSEPSPAITIVGAVGLGLALGAMFGAFQWLALRKHAARASLWIPANAFGWGLAMPWSFAAGASVSAASSPLLAASAAALAGMAMGFTVALVTGCFLRTIRAHSDRRPYMLEDDRAARRAIHRRDDQAFADGSCAGIERIEAWVELDR
jgi:hypothetical protein